MVISNQVGAVDDQDQWRVLCTSPVYCNFLQLVECTFNVQERSRVSRTSNAEQTANIAAKSGQPVILLTTRAIKSRATHSS